MSIDLNFLNNSRKIFKYYKSLGDKTLARLTFEQLAWTPNESSNSIAVIVKHLAGNMISRWTDFLTTDGEKPFRNRDDEFVFDFKNKEEIFSKWEAGWACLFTNFESVNESNFDTKIYIRHEGHSIIEAYQRQLTHVALHVGQMMWIAKSILDENWESLSIARNKSAAFNKTMLSKAEKNDKNKK